MATRAGRLGLWARGLNGNDVWVNPVLRAELGIDPNEAVRVGDILSRIHPDDRLRIISGLDKIITSASAKTWEDEYRFKRTNGEYAYVHDRGHVIYDGEKAATYTRMYVKHQGEFAGIALQHVFNTGDSRRNETGRNLFLFIKYGF